VIPLKISFSHRIIVGFCVMAVLSVLVGYMAFVTTKNVQRVSRAIMKENVSSLKAAEELELALLNQKGLVASLFLDGDQVWLKTLEERKKDFEEWFAKASDVALTPVENGILREIHILYKTYDNQRNKAIKLYQSGSLQEARNILLNDMKKSTDALYQKCEDLILANESLIAAAEASSQKRVAGMTVIIWITVISTLCLGTIMGFLLAKKINEQLVRSAKMATLGQLSANIAHEIRNPLTSIKMRLYTLEEQLKHNPLAQEDLGIINEEIGRMEKTVKNFLDFARLPEPNFQKNDIHAILERTINLLLPKANSQNIAISKIFDVRNPQVNADREQLQQLFLNVMLNAIEAMPQGGALEVATQTCQDRKLNEALEVKIKDNGVGIPLELGHKLFEPFFSTKTEGTGLGLFIVSKIIKVHRGTINLESRPEKGTLVTMRFPFFA
jgi:signal transduction histidine kinase